MKDKLFDISNKIVVLTGVSGQLGCIYAKAFLKRGVKLVGLDLELSKTVDDLMKANREKFLFIKADVTDKNSLEKSLSTIEKKFGSPEVLINNAAIDSPPSSLANDNGPFETYSESSWDNVLNVNLKGVFLASQVFGATMKREKGGSIINISSIYGIVSPDQNLYSFRRDRGEVFFKPVAYSASKSGLINLTKYLAVYWAKDNIRVNTLTIAGVYNNQEKLFLEAYCNRIPVGRMANPEDYNGSLIFLASDASKYMTGSNLVVDGGWTSI